MAIVSSIYVGGFLVTCFFLSVVDEELHEDPLARLVISALWPVAGTFAVLVNVVLVFSKALDG